MKRLPNLLTNTALASILVVLVLGPVGIVGYLGGIDPQVDLGSFLGATVNSKGEVLQKEKEGTIKKIAVKTFWGQQATYRRAINLKNNTTSTQTYQLEILKVNGDFSEEQEILARFSPNQKDTVTLKPKESCWIDIVVTAPEQPNVSPSTTYITVAIWNL